jgi:hypothetical protein
MKTTTRPGALRPLLDRPRRRSRATPAKPATPAVKYGSNATVGRTFVHDGVKLYYEVYGTGEPLLMIHGNGGSIADMTRQIAHFRARYQVIAMDSRDQGKSGDSPGALTYEKMTDDLAALIDQLKVGRSTCSAGATAASRRCSLGIAIPQSEEDRRDGRQPQSEPGRDQS